MNFLVRLIKSLFERTAFLNSESVWLGAELLPHHPKVAVGEGLVANIRSVRCE